MFNCIPVLFGLFCAPVSTPEPAANWYASQAPITQSARRPELNNDIDYINSIHSDPCDGNTRRTTFSCGNGG
jgi:hypothetical protein